jgi:hypothetical protein
MSNRRNRLSLRIPWMIEAVAEGPLAIIALVGIALLVVIARALGWW